MSELKPCPFCGESKLLYSGGCGFRYDDDDNQIRLFRVHCRTCKGRTGLFESLDEAIEAWNRRTNSTTIQPSALSTNLASLGTDLISRQQAIDDIWTVSPLARLDRKWVDRWLRQLPSAQPEIIRCKDCKWWDRYNDNNGYCMAAKSCTYTSHWDIQIRRTYDGDFYCAHAEPKEEYEEDEDE